MCGIAGVLSSILTRPEIDIFEQLMIVSTLRGREGAGIITVDANIDKKNGFNPTRWHKYTGSGAAFIDTKGYKDKVHNRPKSALIGHCRLPTKGAASNIENVHPHIIGELAGVHNGTMWSVNSKYLTDTQSDSLALYKLISEQGIQEAVNNSSGAYALVWVDNANETINFLRNSDRPLWFGVHDWQPDRPTTLFWESEKNFLELCMGRAALKAKVWQLPTDEVHSFPYIPEGVLQPVITPCKKKYYQSYGYNNQGWVTDPVTGKQTWKMREAGETRETFRGRGGRMGELDNRDTEGERESGFQEYEPTTFPSGPNRGQETSPTPGSGSNIIPLIQPAIERSEYHRGHWAERRQELLSLPAPKYDHGVPIPDGRREEGTGTSGAGTGTPSPGDLHKEFIVVEKEIQDFNARLAGSLSVLKKDYPTLTPPVIRGDHRHWRSLPGRKSKSEQKAEKRQRQLARGGKGVHNLGHKGFKETVSGWYVPPAELVKILHDIKCEWCNKPGQLGEYTHKKIKWLARDRFMCYDCTANPDAIDNLRVLFPTAFSGRNPLDKIPDTVDDPVNNLFRRKQSEAPNGPSARPVCVEVEDTQDCVVVNTEATNDNQGTVH